ncbi:DUF5947 family protein [Actinoplanes sp. NPDC051411]|uniref:DUF5947 family protein n=1 Tax=Actinoplanes sp. NPDC051411 TaxID=3155522 RepID=UPI00342A59B6
MAEEEWQATGARIDARYELTGRLRRVWRGFDGREAREEISRFFTRVRERSAT